MHAKLWPVAVLGFASCLVIGGNVEKLINILSCQVAGRLPCCCVNDLWL